METSPLPRPSDSFRPPAPFRLVPGYPTFSLGAICRSKYTYKHARLLGSEWKPEDLEENHGITGRKCELHPEHLQSGSNPGVWCCVVAGLSAVTLCHPLFSIFTFRCQQISSLFCPCDMLCVHELINLTNLYLLTEEPRVPSQIPLFGLHHTPGTGTLWPTCWVEMC